PSPAPDQTRIDAARTDTGIHRAQQGLESARLDVCRADDSLRVHAGHGSGERSSRGLRQTNRRGSCARDLPFSLTDQIDEPILKRFREVFASCTKRAVIQKHHVTLFTAYLEKLRATPDGDGSLLDHTIILYGAGLSNSDR